MLATLTQSARALSHNAGASHVLAVLEAGNGLDADAYARPVLERLLARRGMKPQELATTPVAATTADGALVAWVALERTRPRFQQLTVLRKALQLLLEERPRQIAIALHGSPAHRRECAALALYCAWVNGVPLPSRKRQQPSPLARIRLYGFQDRSGFLAARATAEGNVLARQLTALPPNELTPGAYRRQVRALAREHGWQVEEFDLKRLRAMGAGAFVAVAQGSADQDAAIVRVSRRVRNGSGSAAVVGKGICFDTGGHNLKTAPHMYNMHHDMAGSAVALGVLLGATRLELAFNLDCWLALAQNHLGPRAYKQNDVVKALNGTSIEVIHTDAEGRMVLADALALAARRKPDLMVDFATLTGSMRVAVGSRQSGAFSNDADLGRLAVEVGRASGERITPFPMEDDYEAALESKVADVKQCASDGEADHILAALFLRRFVDERPWIHVDLSGKRCEGGLGAVATDVTGFGVAWGLALLARRFGKGKRAAA